MIVRLRDSYTTDEGPVRLDVTVGDGQKGRIKVNLDDNFLGGGADELHLEVGQGSSIAGKTLRIVATVTDTNEATNLTEVTYALSGGQSPRTWVSRHTVDDEGETVFYDTAFDLL